MHVIRLVASTAALLSLVLACCVPAGKTEEGAGRGPIPLGSPGPAPWAPALAELAVNPTAQSPLVVSGNFVAGTEFDSYDYEITGLGSPSLMVERADPSTRKWFLMSLGSPLPSPAQFAPEGGVRFLVQRRIGLGERALYAVEQGPLAGWYLAYDLDGTRPTQIHVANRRYLTAHLTRIADAAGIR